MTTTLSLSSTIDPPSLLPSQGASRVPFFIAGRGKRFQPLFRMK
jgi:hypothetical protein